MSAARQDESVADNYPSKPAPDVVFVTILRHRRGWQVMWIDARKNFRDFRAATLNDAVTGTSTMAAEFYGASPAGAPAELVMFTFGRRLPVFNKGPQLEVTGEPGQLMAKDLRDGSVFAGATLEDVLVAFGVNPVQDADYAISWTRPVPTAATGHT